MEQESIIRMDEISVKVILWDLLMNIVFLLLAALTAALGIRSYYNLVYVPEYTSTATLAISAKGSPDGNAYSSLTTANSMADVFAEVFQSDIMKEKVEETVGDFTDGTRITSELIPETNLLLVNVTAENPETAYTVIQAVLENYHSVSDYLFGNAVVEMVKNPEVPLAPSNIINIRKYTQEGAFGAFCLAGLLVVGCSLMRNSVKTVRQADRKVEGKRLGVIGHEEKNRTLKAKIKKINKGLLITNPVASFRFEEAYHQLASKVDYLMQREGAKVLMVTSVAENEGKSTVASNLALALANRNKKVLLIDMDFKKPALYRLFDCPSDMPDTLMAYLKGESDAVPYINYDKQKGIYELFNRKVPSSSRKMLNNQRLKALVQKAGMMVDYVILDSSPICVGVDAEILTDISQASILVVRQDCVRISDLNDAIEAMRKGQSKYLGYVLNDFDHGSAGDHYGYYGRYGRYGKYSKYSNSSREDGMNQNQG